MHSLSPFAACTHSAASGNCCQSGRWEPLHQLPACFPTSPSPVPAATGPWEWRGEAFFNQKERACDEWLPVRCWIPASIIPAPRQLTPSHGPCFVCHGPKCFYRDALTLLQKGRAGTWISVCKCTVGPPTQYSAGSRKPLVDLAVKPQRIQQEGCRQRNCK